VSCKATSRLKRASLTCELAGFGAAAEVDRDLLEWNYGNYDERTSTYTPSALTGCYSATGILEGKFDGSLCFGG
jgi:Histidine phosphatase superfamily (branch 1)